MLATTSVFFFFCPSPFSPPFWGPRVLGNGMGWNTMHMHTITIPPSVVARCPAHICTYLLATFMLISLFSPFYQSHGGCGETAKQSCDHCRARSLKSGFVIRIWRWRGRYYLAAAVRLSVRGLGAWAWVWGEERQVTTGLVFFWLFRLHITSSLSTSVTDTYCKWGGVKIDLVCLLPAGVRIYSHPAGR